MINHIYRHARDNPESLAVINSGTEISYRRFASAIEAVRNSLLGERLPDDGVIAIITSNLYQDWVLMLALRSLGLTTIAGSSWKVIEDLELGNLAAMVCYSDHAEAIETCRKSRPDCPVIQVSRTLTAGNGNASPAPVRDGAFGDHIAYTSGTTGTHKKLLFDGELLVPGIENDLTGPIDATIRDADVYFNYNFGAWTKVGYVMPLICWYRGATVIFEQRDDWAERFFDHPVTKTILLPPMLKQLSHAAASRPRSSGPLLVSVGGAFVDFEQARKATRDLGCDLHVGYAGTEFRVALTSLVTTDEDVVWLKRRFDPGIEIVDEDDRPVPKGEEGILRIQLAPSDPTEYIDDPASTAIYFRNGYFYPGDMAVERDDGRIRILGRVADVLNLGGGKRAVEPYEQIARKLLEVEEVCVFNLQQADGRDMVVVAIEGDRIPDRQQLEAVARHLRLGSRIQFSMVSEFPRGENGMMKVNRRKLLKLLYESAEREGTPFTA